MQKALLFWCVQGRRGTSKMSVHVELQYTTKAAQPANQYSLSDECI